MILIYRFALFELDTQAGELRREGRRLPVQDQPLSLLTALVERPGEVVSREELRQHLWPPDVHVDFENGINAAMARLREVLGDSALNPRFVATVKRRGYRFLASVEVVGGEVKSGESLPSSQQSSRGPSKEAEGIAPSPEPPQNPMAHGSMGAARSGTVTSGTVTSGVVTSGAVTSGDESGGVESGAVTSGAVESGAVGPGAVESRGAESGKHRRVAGVAFTALALLVLFGLLRVFDRSRDRPPSPRPSHGVKLAVLPFADLTRPDDESFLGDALSEELIARLGRMGPRGLRVIARTSTQVYRGRDVGIRQIGNDLGVDFVLEGTLRQEADRVRVTAALVEVEEETRLWTGSFERPRESLMALEREMASEVAAVLALELVEASGASKPSGRAHEAYLEGRYYLARLDEESLRKAIRSFEESLLREPRFAAARASLAEAWALLGLFDFEAAEQVIPKALSEAQQAVEIDVASAEGHLMLAVLQHLYLWDFDAAARSFERALALNPSLSRAHLMAADFYTTQGRQPEAVRAIEQGVALDPLSLPTRAQACWLLFVVGLEEEALTQCRRALDLDEDFLLGWDVLKWIHICRGEEQEAIEAFLRVVELEELHADMVPALRELAAQEGLAGLLRNSLGFTEERLAESGQSPYNLALDYAALGDLDAAFRWLEVSFEDRETDLVHLAVDPRLEPLRADPRHSSLMERVGLPKIAAAPTSERARDSIPWNRDVKVPQ